MNKKLFLTALVVPALLSAADSARERLAKATVVLHEIRNTPDKGVPRELLERAQCIVVVPGLKKVAFIGGGKFGRGFASCMTSNGWSSPAGIRIEGGSFGLQLGASSTDVVLLVMNQGGMTKLMSDKVTIGGDASAAAGPIGRTLTANTDVLMHAEILSYSRARGLFAGLSLDGATLRPDNDANKELYGGDETNMAILKGEVKHPAAASQFLVQVARFSGKGAPPVTKRMARKHSSSNGEATTETASTGDNTPPPNTAPDNSKMNKAPMNSKIATADKAKNDKSDIQIMAKIRRSVVTDKSLSTYAHNVKIVSKHGAVTLNGTVHSDDEKAKIEAKATEVAGSGNVTDNITVTPPKQ